jgi:hypothetical protein
MSHKPVRALPLLALLLALSACEDVAPGPLMGPNTIGPEGGTLTFANGTVSLNVPPGAVTAPVSITVRRLDDFPDNPLVVPGTVFEFGPAGLQFAAGVQLAVFYDQAGVAPGVRDEELRLFEVEGGGWVAVGSTVNPAAQAVTATITGFSIFGVAGVPVTGLTVEPESPSLLQGGTFQLVATITAIDGALLPDRPVIWESLNPAVASVSASGLVTAEGVGTAEIVATSEEQSDTITVTVSAVPAASVLIVPDAVGMTPGRTVLLSVEVRDASGTLLVGRQVTWESQAEAVATVDVSGRVSGVGVGTATITASVEGLTDQASANVLDPGLLALEPVVDGEAITLTFLTTPPGDPRLFVSELPGRIRIIENGVLLPTPFLDITNLVSNPLIAEEGLLSFAFHPDYATNGFFYVDYTDDQSGADFVARSRVVRYSVSADPNVADPNSADTILTIDQPTEVHNGGLVSFGPDGMLYIGLGDGGPQQDPANNSQNLGVMLGKLLRVDVDGGEPYVIPPDNPFGDEIWARGLRNPWRYSWDNGSLYVADVGQSTWEEISVVGDGEAGVNYGWRIMEGTNCFPPGTMCDRTGLRVPVLEYSHDEGCSITGGYVYRGNAIPEVQGHYFYADYCSAFLRSIVFENGRVVGNFAWDAVAPEFVVSFGRDAMGELYLTTQAAPAGQILRIVTN